MVIIILPFSIDVHQRPPPNDIDETQSSISKKCLCFVLIPTLIIAVLAVTVGVAYYMHSDAYTKNTSHTKSNF